MRGTSVSVLATALCLGLATAASAQIPCRLSGFSQLPPNTGLSLGPNIYSVAIAYPDLGPAIVGARDAWNVTHASGRLGNWTGIVTGSDCPAGQTPFQLGAFNFQTTQCSTIDAYNHIPGSSDYRNLIAFVDYYSPAVLASVGVSCPQCGTKSMLINTFYIFSFNPMPQQYDVQSIIAHEFGHMLGLWHMSGSVCGDSLDPLRCSQSPNRNTMGYIIYDGETCERDLSLFFDISNANSLY